MADWLLYEHDDGRHAVAPSAEAATFANGDPAWHRVGPVEVPGITARELTNELGNRIRITIEGPTSTSENVLTPMEAAELRAALDAHGVTEGHGETFSRETPMGPGGEG